MIREYRFKNARALTERMRNLYGVCVGCKTITNQLVARGYRTCRILRNPLLNANHRRLCRDWTLTWQSMTVAHFSHAIWGDESPCLQDPEGSVTFWRGFCAWLGGIPHGCQITPCAPEWIGTSMAWCIGTSCGTHWYHLLGSILHVLATKMTMLRLPSFQGSDWLSATRGHP